MTIITKGTRPRDLAWDNYNDTPDVMQMSIKPDTRITWNPDDDRFYVEQKTEPFDDWETTKTFKGNIKGWDNAKYHARKIA